MPNYNTSIVFQKKNSHQVENDNKKANQPINQSINQYYSIKFMIKRDRELLWAHLSDSRHRNNARRLRKDCLCEGESTSDQLDVTEVGVTSRATSIWIVSHKYKLRSGLLLVGVVSGSVTRLPWWSSRLVTIRWNSWAFWSRTDVMIRELSVLILWIWMTMDKSTVAFFVTDQGQGIVAFLYKTKMDKAVSPFYTKRKWTKYPRHFLQNDRPTKCYLVCRNWKEKILCWGIRLLSQ